MQAANRALALGGVTGPILFYTVGKKYGWQNEAFFSQDKYNCNVTKCFLLMASHTLPTLAPNKLN